MTAVETRDTTHLDPSVVEFGSTRLRLRDLFREASAVLRANRLRSVVSGLAIFVAAAAIVAVVVISATIANQVSDEFDALRATSVSVRPTKDIPADKQIFPPDAEDRLATIPGVVAGGVVVTTTKVKANVATSNADPTAAVEVQLIGVDHSVLDATDATIDGIDSQVSFDTSANVAYVGATLAGELGITPPSADDPELQIITVNGLAFQVLGVLQSPQRLTETADAVVIPRTTAEAHQVYEPTDYSMIVETTGGAARNVGADIPLVLAPQRLDPYVIDVPPDANQFRRRVEGNIQLLVFAMAALSALVGAISIASTAYSGVTERTGEFGLRRAFGAKPKHIRRQVITETLAIAVLAAITGELFGLVVSLVISRINNWVTIIDPRILAVIPAGAALLGIAAATIPARKASRIDPSVALRAV